MKDGWNQATLGDMLALIRNGTNCEQTKSGEGHKISRIETIAAASINPEKVGYAKLTEEQKKNFKLRKDDILFSHINSAAHIGKTAIVDQDYGIYHGINLLLLRPTESVDPSYLQHYLNFLFRKGYWRTVCKQSVNQASVNQTDIKKVGIVYPKSLAEQRRIVAILDEAFNHIDILIAYVETNLTMVRELLASYLSSALADSGANCRQFTVADLIKTGIIEKPQDGNHGEIHPKRADYLESGVPFIMAGDLVDGNVDTVRCRFIAESQAKSLRVGFSINGDVLLSHKGTIGRTAILRTDRDYVVLTPQLTYYRIKDTSQLNGEFLYFYFSSRGFQQEIGRIAEIGSTRAYIGINQQMTLKIALPPLEEQIRLANGLRILGAESQKLDLIYKWKLEKLAELKQSLLRKFFEGAMADAAGPVLKLTAA